MMMMKSWLTDDYCMDYNESSQSHVRCVNSTYTTEDGHVQFSLVYGL